MRAGVDGRAPSDGSRRLPISSTRPQQRRAGGSHEGGGCSVGTLGCMVRGGMARSEAGAAVSMRAPVALLARASRHAGIAHSLCCCQPWAQHESRSEEEPTPLGVHSHCAATSPCAADCAGCVWGPRAAAPEPGPACGRVQRLPDNAYSGGAALGLLSVAAAPRWHHQGAGGQVGVHTARGGGGTPDQGVSAVAASPAAGAAAGIAHRCAPCLG